MSGQSAATGASSSATADAPSQHEPPSRKPSSSQPLRHGRKPIYPDSDAEAEGLDADLDDEHLETGLANTNGNDERSSLLSSTRNNHKNSSSAFAGWSYIDHLRARLPKALGGDPARANKLARRRAHLRSASSRRNSRNLSSSAEHGDPTSFAAWRADHPILMRIAYAILGLILALLLLLAIAVIHFFVTIPSAPSAEAQSKILDESLLLQGPDRLQLLNISDDGILVRVDARLGLDPDHALDTWLGPKGQQGWLRNQERKVVDWAMGKVAGVQIDVGEVRLAEMGAAWSSDALAGDADALRSLSLEPLDMLSFHLDPVILPLPALNRKIPAHDADESARPPILGNHSTPAARHNMHALNLTVLLKPVSPAEHIMDYAQHALKSGLAKLDVKISSLRVRGLGAKELHGVSDGRRKTSWFDVPRRIDVSQRLIRSPVEEKVPKLKNDTDTDDLLKLDGYEFFEIGQDEAEGDSMGGGMPGGGVWDLATRALGIRAKAMAKNPLGRMLQGQVGYSLPFGIYLPVGAPPQQHDDGNTTDDSVLMAVVATEPFALTGQKKVKLNLEGRVVPPPKDSKPQSRLDEAPSHVAHAGSQLVFASGPGSIREEVREEVNDADAHAEGGEDTPQQAALSNFLSRFLRGDANTVYVRGGSPFAKKPESAAPPGSMGKPPADKPEPPLPGGGSVLPAWMDSALRLVDLPISFPGSKVTDLIKNVTIADLKITPHPFERDKLLCSGTVMGVMNLPGQLSTVDVKITHLWPDILVFDGKPPSMRNPGHGGDDDDDNDDDPDEEFDGRWLSNVAGGAASLSADSLAAMKDLFLPSSSAAARTTRKKNTREEPVPPLPNPLPSKAFGRVRPHDFAPASTFPDPSDPTGQTKLLRSELKDVPFTVLPGRGPIFRSFTWKLVTGEGALAGIEGSSRAKIWNSGLGTLQLRNLPVKGAFVVGKRG